MGKKELQKRDEELNNIQNILSNNTNNQSIKQFEKQIIKELRSLQIERSKAIKRRDLKHQIKEKDEQIAFLITHFGENQSKLNDKDNNKINERSFSGDSCGTSMAFSSSMASSRSEALAQIDANLTDALAPFHRSPQNNNDENIDINKLSAYHFVPATSSSENINRNYNNKKRKRNKDKNSMLSSIFGDEQQSTSKYHRDTFSSKQKRKQSRYKRSKQKRFENESDDDDDDDYNNNSNFILDDHEDRYKSLDRKYG